MSGAVEICKRYAEMSGKREAAERAAGNEEAAAFESGSTITAMNLADLIARTTPPSRSYADGLAVAAKHLDERAERARVAAIGGGMDPLDAELLDYEYSNAAAAIRLLPQGEKA